jgi:hypothetical protein
VGEPSDDSRDHEEDGEHVGWETHRFVDDAAVEVDVGVELSFDEILVAEGDLFEFDGDFYQVLFASDFEDFVCDSFDDFGSGVVALVDSMAEPVEQFLFVLYVLDELRDVVLMSDSLEHSQDSLVGSTVFGSVKGSRSTSDTGVDVDS